IAELLGQRLYALGAINEGARVAAIGLNTALDIAGALLGIDVFASVSVLASGSGGFWDAMNIVASMNPVGRLGKVGGALGKMFKFGRRGARAGNRFVGAFKTFTLGNFRHNLKVMTKFDAPTSIHAHHMLPLRHAEKFKRARMNIHDPKWGAWWGGGHLSHSNRYNRAWKDFFREHANPGPGQVESHARKLAADFGLTINF
ncbi:MAG: hypothetical protein IH986_09180, partial [Planctomycetes bacterium]|nr:hypothetical protein [Planctomycetota bacterium]